MNNQQAYNQWAETYNDVVNKTRDVELNAKKEILKDIPYSTVLELGCGTGKNTQWLLQKAMAIIAVDFSESMMAKAKVRIQNEKVNFVQADINEDWHFVKEPVDLITCSLVLEHIEALEPVFTKAAAALNNGGHFYIGELHPFKQYNGSKARFQKAEETLILDCYIHHIFQFTQMAGSNGFTLVYLNEWFDEDNRQLPRILTLLFRKN
ncbi:MAG: class I SAM-dependent methyltransferase [Sphingobacteriales bacterium]|nr:MAG: class I SAM-dependent methyltransferase [Sphingobacteriales bacterium]